MMIFIWMYTTIFIPLFEYIKLKISFCESVNEIRFFLTSIYISFRIRIRIFISSSIMVIELWSIFLYFKCNYIQVHVFGLIKCDFFSCSSGTNPFDSVHNAKPIYAFHTSQCSSGEEKTWEKRICCIKESYLSSTHRNRNFLQSSQLSMHLNS